MASIDVVPLKLRSFGARARSPFGAQLMGMIDDFVESISNPKKMIPQVISKVFFLLVPVKN